MSNAANPPPNPYSAPQHTSPPPLPRGAGAFAPCPNCGGTLATKVGFSWWGGLLGPKLLSHVKCANCRTKYNGQTGHYNTLGIAVYLGGCLLFGVVIFIAVVILGMS